MTRKVNNCQLEIDEERGVIYVHSPRENTLLRICKIPKVVARSDFIDVVFDRELAKGCITKLPYQKTGELPPIIGTTITGEPLIRREGGK